MWSESERCLNIAINSGLKDTETTSRRRPAWRGVAGTSLSWLIRIFSTPPLLRISRWLIASPGSRRGASGRRQLIRWINTSQFSSFFYSFTAPGEKHRQLRSITFQFNLRRQPVGEELALSFSRSFIPKNRSHLRMSAPGAATYSHMHSYFCLCSSAAFVS